MGDATAPVEVFPAHALVSVHATRGGATTNQLAEKIVALKIIGARRACQGPGQPLRGHRHRGSARRRRGAAFSGKEAGPGGPDSPGDVDGAGNTGAVHDGALDAREWCTTERGKHFEVETETGETTEGNIGQEEWDSLVAQEARREKVAGAMRQIGNGKEEVVLPALRNDLEQYGGTNDMTIIRGDGKKDWFTSGGATGAPALPRCSKR